MSAPELGIEKSNLLKYLKRMDDVSIVGLVDMAEGATSAIKGRKLDGYIPHDKQLTYHKLGLDHPLRCFFAGNRVGKTTCGAAEDAYHLTGLYPSWWVGRRFDKPVDLWACSETTESVRDIIQTELVGVPQDRSRWGEGWIPRECQGRVTMKSGVADAIDTMMVKHVPTGRWSSLEFKSYDQGRRRFQGTKRHVIHLDEEPPKPVFDECRMRTIDTAGMIMLTMTPLAGMTEICSLFLNDDLNKRDPHAAHVIASWADNPHLNTELIAELERAMRPHEREARQHGIPVLGSGRIYTMLEEWVQIADFKIPDYWPRLCALDFGWKWTAGVWGAWDREAGIRYIYSVYKAGEASPLEHSESLKHRGDWIPYVGDPSGNKQRSQTDGEFIFDKYREHGIEIHPANNKLEAGIHGVYDAMKFGELKVFSSCLAWFEEFRFYHRDEKGKVVKRSDHLMDCTRYYNEEYSTRSAVATKHRWKKPSRKRDRPSAWTM